MPSGRRRLPSLNAVCAFEACARLGSTVGAAAELGVTHGAVSKQMALLEGWFEVAMFDRSGVRLTPTAAGARYAAAIGRALDLVDSATRDIAGSTSNAETIVRVSTTASFAALWLLPRLTAFRTLHPDIEVWVSESKAAVEIGARSGVDLALRTGRGPWPGVRAEVLMSDHVIPVCAPSLSARLQRPEDLARATLLHDEDPRVAWRGWLEKAGVGRPSWGDRGPRLGDGALLLQAAVDGQGVALARRRLAKKYLRSGRLIQPFGPVVSLGPDCWLVLPARGTPMTRPARIFAAWVREAALRG